MKAIQQKLKTVQDLLQKEKEADFDRFREEVLQLTQSERRDKGLCWYPLNVLKTGYTVGERAFVTVERTAQINESHRLRSGSPIEFYTSSDDKNRNHAQRGIIHFVERNKMKIILNNKDIPDWINDGQLAVEMLFDERTYLEMEKAMKVVLKASDDRLTELKRMFYGDLQPEFAPLKEVHHDLLNEAQKQAVQSIIAAKDIAIVHGPPGTGKTTTLVHAIKLLAKTEKNILVTASSNAAVDLMVERLAEQGLNVVRIGNISRVNDQLVSMTLDGRLAQHPEHKNIKRLRVQAANARKGARKFKRRFGSKQRSQRNENYQEARELESYAKMLEERLLHEILFQADVIACTLVNTQSNSLQHMKFKTVVIDEAAQAIEPATWIPLIRVQKVILAGDPYQLPPVIKSPEAREKGLGMTLLEKWVRDGKPTSFLDTQYRMHPTIMGFSNTIFYENNLKAAPSVVDQKVGIPDLSPVLFIDTAGCGFNEEINPETKSRYNEGEAFILREYFLKFTGQLTEQAIPIPSMAIIAPYREQARHLSQLFQEDEELLPFADHLSINSVDAFQGQEREIIFISLTRSNDKAEIGFLSDYRRMNVALTRAKKHLVVIGDSATIGADDFYQKFIEYAETKGQYQSAWEYMKS